MSRRVTVTEVAEHARVSRQTVSNALNRPDVVRPTTLDRVRRAVAELGYRPMPAARQLRSGRYAPSPLPSGSSRCPSRASRTASSTRSLPLRSAVTTGCCSSPPARTRRTSRSTRSSWPAASPMPSCCRTRTTTTRARHGSPPTTRCSPPSACRGAPPRQRPTTGSTSMVRPGRPWPSSTSQRWGTTAVAEAVGLSSLAQPLREAADLIVGTVLEAVAPPHQTLLAPALVARSSRVPPPQIDPPEERTRNASHAPASSSSPPPVVQTHGAASHRVSRGAHARRLRRWLRIRRRRRL